MDRGLSLRRSIITSKLGTVFMSIVQHLYSSDIPSDSACAIVVLSFAEASLGFKSSSKKTQCTEMKLPREIGHWKIFQPRW